MKILFRLTLMTAVFCLLAAGCSCGDPLTSSGQADDDSTSSGPDSDDAADDTAVDDDSGDDSDDASDDSADDDTLDDAADDDSADDDTVSCPDADGDGYTDKACGGTDCNDADPEIHPGAYDVCGDGIDNNCDNTVDNPDDVYVELPEFVLGDSQFTSSGVHYLAEAGVRWARPSITLRNLKPEVTDPELTMADIEANPGLIDDFIAEANWTGYDNMLRQVIAQGVQPFPSVGHGWIGTLPSIDGETATPDRLGKDHYLAQQYRCVRAVVERYDGDGDRDADGIVIKTWQIENELNQAMTTTLYGWREPTGLQGLFSAWADWDFLTELLGTLNRAVHDSDPEAITTQNLHTDVHPNFSFLLGQPSWIKAATLWRDQMDIIGFDAYPNYYMSEPVGGEVVGERVTTLLGAACGKPVIAMEIGYPSGPAELGFTQANQAQFLDEAFHSAYDAGAVGYFLFGLVTSETHSVTITPEDIAAMAYLGPLATSGDVIQLVIWALQNLDYVLDPHLIDVLQSVEGYWGLVNADGSHKPMFATLEAIADEVYP